MNDNLQEDIEDFIRKQDEYRRFNLQCQELKKEFDNGILNDLKPCWQLIKENIDFNLQKDQLAPDLLVDGFTLVSSVEIAQLFSTFQPAFVSFITNKTIANRGGFIDNQICRIIGNWKVGQPLIPPTILFNDLTKLNYVHDGKHRLKLAHYYGATKIPIIVPNAHLKFVMALINMTND